MTHIATHQQDGTSIEEVEEEEEPEAAALTGAAAVVVLQLLHTQACTRAWSVGVPVDTPTAGGGCH